MEPVRIPIEDVLDLHTFHPRDIPDLIEDYLEECVRLGFRSVRIIHGKGTGAQKKRVRELLARNPHVAAAADAPIEAGGWGATTVALRPAAARPGPPEAI
ncbi:MAG: Smr/MutS family protein [Desulfobacterales bacterium]|jgi:DNA-nicking Smr family endonuclease|nr:Smr/MutS family protein [Desulfobacterales bacterium]